MEGRAQGQNKWEANFCFPAFDFAMGIVLFWQSFQHVISLVWKEKHKRSTLVWQ